MADLLYCGTPPVGPDETQAMLASEFRAIWAPPMYRRVSPLEGDRLWLVWRATPQSPVQLLGGGVVEVTPEGRVDWTNRTLRGVVDAAKAAGYSGPSNMAFLRLADVRLAQQPSSTELGELRIGLNAATTDQVVVLQRLLPI